MTMMIKAVTLLLMGVVIVGARSRGSITFLEWGDKCKIPQIGGDSFTEECDAGKGLMCTGEACECTYKQRYSYDHFSKECRRRVGKPCQYVDIGVKGEEALAKMPFNLKCHQNAFCAQMDLPLTQSRFAPGGVVDIEKVSMCVCQEGYVAASDLNSCIVPPPPMVLVDILTPPPKKLEFREPYYTT